MSEEYRSVLRLTLAERFNLDADSVKDETELFSSGMLDSFAMLELVSVVEEMRASRVRPIDVNLDNFDSISRIITYFERQESRG